MQRRDFLSRCGALLGAGLLGGMGPLLQAASADGSVAFPQGDEWASIRNQFSLSPDYIHMSALLIASHPKPVQEAIDGYRRKLDELPVVYLQAENRQRQRRACQAAARYLGATPSEIALTDSTTMGLGLVYGGLRLGAGDELLTSDHDYYATHESLRLAAARARASVRKVALYRPGEALSVEQIVERVEQAIRPQTRVLALTWVHSNSGIKLPISSIGLAIERLNAERAERERILFCVDGVHGFGVEDVRVADLRCDFFIAGCHKWLFGPRGTGIVWGRPQAWASLLPTIPSFIDNDSWAAWQRGDPTPGETTARMMTPGGFKPFEHLWAVTEAFEFHQAIGKAKVMARTRMLARQLKEGLAGMSHVRLITPRYDHLSAGIVSFDLVGMSPWHAVRRLRERKIVATVSPYATRHVRLTPSLRNAPEEVDAVLRAIRDLA